MIKYRKQIEKQYKHTCWEPKVSIVIPVYNESEKILESTVWCVLNSNYPKSKLEVIIIDDGSKNDSCKKVYEKYKTQGVKLYKKENGGAADAKNYGIKKANGELIGTVDSDSFVAPDTIREMVDLFEDKKTGAVTSAVKIFKPRKFIEKFQHFEYEVILYVRRIFMKYESVYVTPGGFSLYRSNILKILKGFDTKSLTEDIEIALRIQGLGYKIRSSLDAFVYTVPPQNLKGLIMQRVRWIRGGIRSRIKNKHLFDPEYGDFVFLGMCFDFIILIPIVIGIITPAVMYILNGPWMNSLGIQLSYLSSSHLAAIGIIISLLTIFWTIAVIKKMEERSEKGARIGWNVPGIILFIFGYGYIMVFAWLIAFFKEITFAEQSWETR